MEVNAQVEITGAKNFVGNVEGVQYDSTTIFVKTELDESRDNAKGYATTEYKFGTSAEYERLKGLPFPFMADVTIELGTTGKRDTKRLVSLRPVVRNTGTGTAGAPSGPSNPLK